MKIDEGLITTLVQETGCDRTLAGMLLKFTGGDIDGAKRILKAVPKDIFVFKIKFVTQITSYYGAMLICYDSKEKRIRRPAVVVTDEKDIGKIDIKNPWRDFENQLYEYAKIRKVDAIKIENIKRRLAEKEFIEKLEKIISPSRAINREALNALFLDELYTIFADTNIALKVDIEQIDVFELNRGIESIEELIEPEERSEAEKIKEKQPFKRREYSLVVLKIEPVLSPVSGRPIKELEFGDEIQVRITDERDIADYLAELLGGKVDSMRVPIHTKIIEVKPLEGGNVGVLTQFGPGILGMFKIQEDAKVLTKASETENIKPKEEKKEISPYLVTAGIVVVVVLFLLLIIFAR